MLLLFSLTIKLSEKSCVILADKCYLMSYTGGQRLLRKGRRANTQARETGMQICLFKTVFTARAVSFFICFCLAL